MNSLPSYIFTALGVALVVLGLAGLIFGDGTLDRVVCAGVLVIGLVQVTFGVKRRTEEDPDTASTR